MSGRELAHNPAILFASGAICRLLVGIPSLHSDWLSLDPPRGLHFAIGSGGEELCETSAVFALCAGLYFLFPKIFRSTMNGLLGKIHFLDERTGRGFAVCPDPLV